MKKSIQISVFKHLLNLTPTHKFKNVLATLFIATTFFSNSVSAQSMLDASVGTSHQDSYFTNFAFRYQVSSRFRFGLEAQIAAPKYRFIDAKPITEGYSSTFSIPLTYRLYEKEQIRLDLYTKAGIRSQGILDPDNNDKRDSVLKSAALVFEPGLLVTVKLSEKLNMQSGVTFPLAYQTSPSTLLENIYPGLLHFGINYRASEKSIVFIKSAFGSAAGGTGDTQKFGKSLQAGIRVNFGKKQASSFVEPTF